MKRADGAKVCSGEGVEGANLEEDKTLNTLPYYLREGLATLAVAVSMDGPLIVMKPIVAKSCTTQTVRDTPMGGGGGGGPQTSCQTGFGKVGVAHALELYRLQPLISLIS